MLTTEKTVAVYYGWWLTIRTILNDNLVLNSSNVVWSKSLGDVVFLGNDVWFWQKINSFSVLCIKWFVWNMFQNVFFGNSWKQKIQIGFHQYTFM